MSEKKTHPEHKYSVTFVSKVGTIRSKIKPCSFNHFGHMIKIKFIEMTFIKFANKKLDKIAQILQKFKCFLIQLSYFSTHQNITKANRRHFQILQIHQNCFFSLGKCRYTQYQLSFIVQKFILQLGTISRKINSRLGIDYKGVLFTFSQRVTGKGVWGSRTCNLAFKGHFQSSQFIGDCAVSPNVLEILARTSHNDAVVYLQSSFT